MNLLNELFEGAKVSWAAIRANKMRSVLTTLGVVIGIVTVTLMGTAIQGLDKAFLKSISAIGSDVLYIQKRSWFSDEPWWETRNRRNITIEQAEFVAKEATCAEALSIQASTFRTVKHGNRSATMVQIIGGTEQSAAVSSLPIKAGRFMSAAEVDGARPVCVIGSDIAEKFFPNEPALGKRIKVENASYQVIGVTDKMGEFLGVLNLDHRIMIPISRLLTDLIRREDVTIEVKVKNMADIDEAVEELRFIMRRARGLAPGDKDDFAINRQDNFIKTFERVSATIASVGLFITGLALFVGGIGIMNIMFVSVAERTREIGIRKAVGAKKRAIMIQFLIESAVICLIGGVIALALAYPLTLLLRNWLPASMSLSIAFLALLVSAFTGMVSGFFPAYRAAGMDPVEALRWE
ncbi:MAG: ABC transporter permease [Verrucomicrobia bacterium]|nr:ABC transporter permease [Verrucomicrobiota bacterium]